MAITSANILKAVNDALSRSETDIDDIIKRVAVDISLLINAIEGQAAIVTEADKDDYSLMELSTPVKSLISVRCGDTVLRKEPWGDLVERNQRLSASEPDRWAIRDNMLILSPVPDGVYTLDLRYWAIHPESTTILYPDHYRRAINEGCIAEFAREKGDYENAAPHQEQYLLTLKALEALTRSEVRCSRYRDI